MQHLHIIKIRCNIFKTANTHFITRAIPGAQVTLSGMHKKKVLIVSRVKHRAGESGETFWHFGVCSILRSEFCGDEP